jgi:hypothetical protein
MAASGSKNVHAFYSRTGLAPLRALIASRVEAGAASELLGITRHGVEQLACLNLLNHLGDQEIEVLYDGLQISAKSLRELADRLLAGACRWTQPEETISIRRALLTIGGREKPWGPIISLMLAGCLPYGLSTGKGRLVSRMSIRIQDIITLAALAFDRRDHAFPFAATMPRRDAEELLNLTPNAMYQAIRTELRNCHGQGKKLLVAPLLQIARSRISSSEILARWGNGRRRPADLRKKGSPRRIGNVGWDRTEVEKIFVGSDPAAVD